VCLEEFGNYVDHWNNILPENYWANSTINRNTFKKWRALNNLELFAKFEQFSFESNLPSTVMITGPCMAFLHPQQRATRYSTSELMAEVQLLLCYVFDSNSTLCGNRGSCCNFLYSFLNTQNLCSTIYSAGSRNYILQLFFLFYMQLLSSIAQNVKVWLKTRALKLLQYSSILFDMRNKELCDGLAASQCPLWRKKYQSGTVGQIVKLPSNFMHCGAKF